MVFNRGGWIDTNINSIDASVGICIRLILGSMLFYPRKEYLNVHYEKCQKLFVLTFTSILFIS